MIIKLPDHQKKTLKEAIRDYYLEERDEDIGIILQEGLYELFMEQFAPVIYNQALEDAKRWFSGKMEDLESDYYGLYRDAD